MLSIRKIGVFGRTYRHLNRYRQILTIFFKYGFGDLVELLKIEQYIEIGLQMISRKRRERLEKLTRWERIRMALEELGPTYIKLGQVLSTRPDLIPVDLVTELSKLQDNVPSFPYPAVRAIIQKDLGGPPEEFFDELEEFPLASASIAQVHRARLKEGEQVAVKVRRPGIESTIEVDLEIMLHLATLMERHVEEAAHHRPIKIVEEFANTMEKEIDFTIEAGSIERISRFFLGDSSLYVPKVYRSFSSPRILTTEYVDGIKISKLDALDAAGMDRKRITCRGAEVMLKQIFRFGFFHGDPHPGNIFVLPDEVICLVDFGMMGAVNRQTREDFVELVDAVVHRNESRTAQVLLKISLWEEKPDMRAFEKEVADFMGRHLHRPLKEIRMGRLLQNMLELASRHRLRIPPDIFLMLKAITSVEGVALQLDPDFDILQLAAPYVKQVKMERYHPKRIAEELLNTGGDLIRFIQEFPDELLEIARQLKQQKLSVNFQLKGLDAMLETHDQISNRISFAIIIAGLVIGSSIIVVTRIPPLFFGISFLGIIIFVPAAVLGLWLLWNILRGGRH
ncbi:MAG: ABC1 kinase family protein [Desulfobacterales bacterium]